MKNLDYRNLAALDAVITHGNFEKAALVLAISQSAVSQRIKALEDAAGRLLVVRGQPAMPTGLGLRLIAHFQHVKLMENALEIELGQNPRMPSIAVAVDADSLATWFGEATQPLIAPGKCLLDIRLGDVDAAMRALREGQLFGCVSGAADAQAGTSATDLGTMRYALMATPAFAAQWFGHGVTLEAALSAPAVACNPALHARCLSRHFALEGQFPHHALATPSSQLAYVGAGWAYGLLPLLAARAALADGSLIVLLPDATVDVALRWHAWNIQTPVTQLLSEQVIGTARRHLLQ